MSAPVIPIPPNIASITAPLLFGEIFNVYFFGILSVQLYLYYITFPEDALYIKLLVYSVFAIDTASTILCMADVYHWFAAGFGSMIALNDIHFSGIDTPLMGAIIAATVQGFYCYRIYRINVKAWPVCVFTLLVALLEVAIGAYDVSIGKTFSKSTATAGARDSVFMLFISAAVADSVIAITMIILLRQASQKVHQRSTMVVTKIISLTAETNLLSTTFALLVVILHFGVPGTQYFLFPSIILGKIYSNSLLLILNNRNYLSSPGKSGFGTHQSSGGTYLMNSMRAGPGTGQSQSMRIDVNTTIGEADTKLGYSNSYNV
jgi:hypothetical protein